MLRFLSIQEATCLNSIFTRVFSLLPRDCTIHHLLINYLLKKIAPHLQPVTSLTTKKNSYSLNRHLSATSIVSDDVALTSRSSARIMFEVLVLQSGTQRFCWPAGQLLPLTAATSCRLQHCLTAGGRAVT